MSFEDFEKKPPRIREAMQHDDIDRLRAAGRKGAAVANEHKARVRDEEDAIAALRAEKAAAEEQKRREAANEHIIDPDGIDQDFSPSE